MVRFSKFIFLFLAVNLIFFNGTIFADNLGSIVEKKVELKGGEITFVTRGTVHKIDYRCVPTGVISIIESKKGLLKDGKAIYLALDGNEALCVENNVQIRVIKGANIKVNSKADMKKNIVKLELERKKSNSTIPAEIQIEVQGYILKKIEEGTELPCAVQLITDTQYKDNLFYDKGKEPIILNDEFIKLVNFAYPKKELVLWNTLSMKIGEQSVALDGQKITVDTPCYIDENGTMMVSIKSMMKVLENNPSIVFRWDNDFKIFTISAGAGERVVSINTNTNEANINGISVPLLTPLQMKEDEIFISIRDFAYFFGISDSKIVWDENSSTVILNLGKE